jgi:hypothetical protein
MASFVLVFRASEARLLRRRSTSSRLPEDVYRRRGSRGCPLRHYTHPTPYIHLTHWTHFLHASIHPTSMDTIVPADHGDVPSIPESGCTDLAVLTRYFATPILIGTGIKISDSRARCAAEAYKNHVHALSGRTSTSSWRPIVDLPTWTDLNVQVTVEESIAATRHTRDVRRRANDEKRTAAKTRNKLAEAAEQRDTCMGLTTDLGRFRKRTTYRPDGTPYEDKAPTTQYGKGKTAAGASDWVTNSRETGRGASTKDLTQPWRRTNGSGSVSQDVERADGDGGRHTNGISHLSANLANMSLGRPGQAVKAPTERRQGGKNSASMSSKSADNPRKMSRQAPADTSSNFSKSQPQWYPSTPEQPEWQSQVNPLGMTWDHYTKARCAVAVTVHYSDGSFETTPYQPGLNPYGDMVPVSMMLPYQTSLNPGPSVYTPMQYAPSRSDAEMAASLPADPSTEYGHDPRFTYHNGLLVPFNESATVYQGSGSLYDSSEPTSSTAQPHPHIAPSEIAGESSISGDLNTELKAGRDAAVGEDVSTRG